MSDNDGGARRVFPATPPVQPGGGALRRVGELEKRLLDSYAAQAELYEELLDIREALERLAQSAG